LEELSETNAMENVRRIYNPVQQDYATFLKTSAETGGEVSLLEVEVAPGGGNGLHYHAEFSEGFEVLEGELGVQVGDKQKVLKPGEKAVVPPDTLHRFYNATSEPVRFLVEVKPGHSGFEDALRIAYGLASDGEVTSDGTPKDFLTLAYIVQISGTKLNGPLAVLQPVFGVLAKIAERRGVDKRLAEKYLRAF
jgi:mannose-6-phosphate isomerase-like protein (cupin superfamily)